MYFQWWKMVAQWIIFWCVQQNFGHMMKRKCLIPFLCGWISEISGVIQIATSRNTCILDMEYVNTELGSITSQKTKVTEFQILQQWKLCSMFSVVLVGNRYLWAPSWYLRYQISLGTFQNIFPSLNILGVLQLNWQDYFEKVSTSYWSILVFQEYA